MDLICKRCDSIFQIETERELICVNCKVQLDLLEKQLQVNDERIQKLEEHQKSELKNPKSENPETNSETMKRLEYNLQLEYKKREGIIKTINSKEIF